MQNTFTLQYVRVVRLMDGEKSRDLVVIGRMDVLVDAVSGQLHLLGKKHSAGEQKQKLERTEAKPAALLEVQENYFFPRKIEPAVWLRNALCQDRTLASLVMPPVSFSVHVLVLGVLISQSWRVARIYL